MSIDLNAIKARAEAADAALRTGDRVQEARYAAYYLQDIPALLDEIERLREFEWIDKTLFAQTVEERDKAEAQMTKEGK